MANLLARSLKAGLRRLESLAGEQTFTWKTAEIPCTPSSLSRGVVIEIGGNPVEISLTLYVRLDEFVTADSTIITIDDNLHYTADSDRPVPVAKQQIKFRGVPYLILSAKMSAPQSHVVLHLADAHSARK